MRKTTEIVLESRLRGEEKQVFIIKDKETGHLYWNRVKNRGDVDLDPFPLVDVADWYKFRFLFKQQYKSLSPEWFEFMDEARQLFYKRSRRV